MADAAPPPHRPRKRFGQHFLEPAWADKLINAVAPSPDDLFIEIGPGRGILTRRLTARAGRVVGVELDRDLAAALREVPVPNLQIVEGDFLKVGEGELRRALETDAAPRRLRVAGNLPYNVASPIMFRLVELYNAGLPIVDATLMLQREVADRLLAAVGTRDYSVLTVLIRQAASVSRLLQLPPGAFRPPPKVHSTVVRLAFHPPDPAVQRQAAFAALTQAVFSRRRKTLANALLGYPPASGLAREGIAESLRSLGIDPQRRPETLSPDELGRLADGLPPAVL
jgi:16S rRNA (adenine1518-N6/adenine1519-N6)-dimethyltransferase